MTEAVMVSKQAWDSMSRHIGVVTPKTTDRAEQLARELYRAFGQKTLPECQDAAARVFGHKTWNAMTLAMREGSCTGNLDEDLTRSERLRRREAQATLLAMDIAGVEPEQTYGPPATMGLEYLGAADPRLAMRLELASMRRYREVCVMHLWEIEPTSGQVMLPVEVRDTELQLATQSVMETLPLALSHWWAKHMRHQPEVAASLKDFTWDKNRPTSVLNLGGYWGELCMYYADAIGMQMCMGTAWLLAQQYAQGVVQATETFRAECEVAADKQRERFGNETKALARTMESSFLMTYPRDDLVEVPHGALAVCAKKALASLKAASKRRAAL